MSSQSFRKKTRIVIRNLDLKFIQSQQKTHHKTFQKNTITYLRREELIPMQEKYPSIIQVFIVALNLDLVALVLL